MAHTLILLYTLLLVSVAVTELNFQNDTANVTSVSNQTSHTATLTSSHSISVPLTVTQTTTPTQQLTVSTSVSHTAPPTVTATTTQTPSVFNRTIFSAGKRRTNSSTTTHSLTPTVPLTVSVSTTPTATNTLGTIPLNSTVTVTTTPSFIFPSATQSVSLSPSTTHTQTYHATTVTPTASTTITNTDFRVCSWSGSGSITEDGSKYLLTLEDETNLFTEKPRTQFSCGLLFGSSASALQVLIMSTNCEVLSPTVIAIELVQVARIEFGSSYTGLPMQAGETLLQTLWSSNQALQWCSICPSVEAVHQGCTYVSITHFVELPAATRPASSPSSSPPVVHNVFIVPGKVESSQITVPLVNFHADNETEFDQLLSTDLGPGVTKIEDVDQNTLFCAPFTILVKYDVIHKVIGQQVYSIRWTLTQQHNLAPHDEQTLLSALTSSNRANNGIIHIDPRTWLFSTTTPFSLSSSSFDSSPSHWEEDITELTTNLSPLSSSIYQPAPPQIQFQLNCTVCEPNMYVSNDAATTAGTLCSDATTITYDIPRKFPSVSVRPQWPYQQLKSMSDSSVYDGFTSHHCMTNYVHSEHNVHSLTAAHELCLAHPACYLFVWSSNTSSVYLCSIVGDIRPVHSLSQYDGFHMVVGIFTRDIVVNDKLHPVSLIGTSWDSQCGTRPDIKWVIHYSDNGGAVITVIGNTVLIDPTRFETNITRVVFQSAIRGLTVSVSINVILPQVKLIPKINPSPFIVHSGNQPLTLDASMSVDPLMKQTKGSSTTACAQCRFRWTVCPYVENECLLSTDESDFFHSVTNNGLSNIVDSTTVTLTSSALVNTMAFWRVTRFPTFLYDKKYVVTVHVDKENRIANSASTILFIVSPPTEICRGSIYWESGGKQLLNNDVLYIKEGRDLVLKAVMNPSHCHVAWQGIAELLTANGTTLQRDLPFENSHTASKSVVRLTSDYLLSHPNVQLYSFNLTMTHPHSNLTSYNSITIQPNFPPLWSTLTSLFISAPNSEFLPELESQITTTYTYRELWDTVWIGVSRIPMQGRPPFQFAVGYVYDAGTFLITEERVYLLTSYQSDTTVFQVAVPVVPFEDTQTSSNLTFVILCKDLTGHTSICPHEHCRRTVQVRPERDLHKIVWWLNANVFGPTDVTYVALLQGMHLAVKGYIIRTRQEEGVGEAMSVVEAHMIIGSLLNTIDTVITNLSDAVQDGAADIWCQVVSLFTCYYSSIIEWDEDVRDSLLNALRSIIGSQNFYLINSHCVACLSVLWNIFINSSDLSNPFSRSGPLHMLKGMGYRISKRLQNGESFQAPSIHIVRDTLDQLRLNKGWGIIEDNSISTNFFNGNSNIQQGEQSNTLNVIMLAIQLPLDSPRSSALLFDNTTTAEIIANMRSLTILEVQSGLELDVTFSPPMRIAFSAEEEAIINKIDLTRFKILCGYLHQHSLGTSLKFDGVQFIPGVGCSTTHLTEFVLIKVPINDTTLEEQDLPDSPTAGTPPNTPPTSLVSHTPTGNVPNAQQQQPPTVAITPQPLIPSPSGKTTPTPTEGVPTVSDNDTNTDNSNDTATPSPLEEHLGPPAPTAATTRGDSPMNATVLLVFVVVACIIILVLLIVLFLCYRSRKSPQRTVNPHGSTLGTDMSDNDTSIHVSNIHIASQINPVQTSLTTPAELPIVSLVKRKEYFPTCLPKSFACCGRNQSGSYETTKSTASDSNEEVAAANNEKKNPEQNAPSVSSGNGEDTGANEEAELVKPHESITSPKKRLVGQ